MAKNTFTIGTFKTDEQVPTMWHGKRICFSVRLFEAAMNRIERGDDIDDIPCDFFGVLDDDGKIFVNKKGQKCMFDFDKWIQFNSYIDYIGDSYVTINDDYNDFYDAIESGPAPDDAYIQGLVSGVDGSYDPNYDYDADRGYEIQTLFYDGIRHIGARHRHSTPRRPDSLRRPDTSKIAVYADSPQFSYSEYRTGECAIIYRSHAIWGKLIYMTSIYQ